MGQEMVKKLKKQFKGKKVLVAGLGLLGGGVGLAKFFYRLGARVTVTDLKSKNELSGSTKLLKKYDIKFTLGRHRLSDFLSSDFIFKGPSVPWNSPYIIAAQKKWIPVEMEASFFASFCPATLIGVTGTRGKSTTTYMIYELLHQTGKRAFLGGNMPNVSTVGLLEKVSEKDFVVLELSSWALSGFHRKKISPDIAVFTNLHTDHLNYYSSVRDYLHDKKAIYLYQDKDDFLVAGKRLENEIRKDHPKSKTFFFKKDDFPKKLKFLRGEHNRENAAASFTVSKILKINQEKAFKILQNFKGLPYRQETVGKKGKVVFINDTTSTTPVATTYAISAFSDKPIILIVGGNSKKLPFGDLLRKIDEVKWVVLLNGTFTDEIGPNLKKMYPSKVAGEFENLDQAVRIAYRKAREIHGDSYVLFSPAATSFSMFQNEFQRGEAFNEAIKNFL